MDPTLAAVLLFIVHVSAGLALPQPSKLKVKILDGEVMAHWEEPTGAPADVLYNVEISKYADEWTVMLSCSETTHTFCDLTSFIDSYYAPYRVRVQMVTDNETSEWTAVRILPNQSQLQPPSFTLWATSSTIRISIHEKPILKQLFHYGLVYTIYLEEKGQEINDTTTYLREEVWDKGKTTTFGSLRWGEEYCVRVKVQGVSTLLSSSMSPSQCLRLPEQEWFIISVLSLSAVGVLATLGVMVIGLLCYVKRPAKTPASLKSSKPGWHPLTVGEGVMEVVTDKGWYLSAPKARSTLLHVTETEGDGEENRRRTSMDSGVCEGSTSVAAAAANRSGAAKQDDSGFGSMGSPEGSDSGQTDYPLQDGDSEKKGEDSGVWEGDAGGGGGGSYRSQRPSAPHVCNVEAFQQQAHVEAVLAEVVSGYRAGPQACICAGAGCCTWCHKHGLGRFTSPCGEAGLLGGLTLSSYASKADRAAAVTAAGGGGTTLLELEESFPLLTALTDAGRDVNMNHVALSLCDLQLQAD